MEPKVFLFVVRDAVHGNERKIGPGDPGKVDLYIYDNEDVVATMIDSLLSRSEKLNVSERGNEMVLIPTEDHVLIGEKGCIDEKHFIVTVENYEFKIVQLIWYDGSTRQLEERFSLIMDFVDRSEASGDFKNYEE